MANLAIRTELFEHGLFPMKTKLTPQILINVINHLSLMSSIDYKIKLNQWVDSAMQFIQGMTEQDAKIYFITYKAILEDIDNSSFQQQKDAPLNEYQVDVRCFSLFIAIQLYSVSAIYSTEQRNNLTKDSWGIKESTGLSSQASPRSKYTKINYTQSEYSIISHFIKTNMKLFLRLISTDQHNAEVSLSASEFNTLRVLFKIQYPSGMKNVNMSQPSLSSLAPFYNQGGHSVKVRTDIISDWLLQMLLPNEPEDEVIYMNCLNKCVTIRDSQIANKDVRIQGCEDSYIYIDTNVQFMQVSNCVNCTIMIAAVNKTCSIDKCENVTVCVASNYLRIGNCVDCTVNSYTQMNVPMIYGDTRNLVMAPHNASYFELMTHLKNANIAFMLPQTQVPVQIQKQFEQSIHNFAKPLQLNIESQCYSIMQPMEFMKMSLPKKFNDYPPLLCPQEYVDVLQIRLEFFNDVQQKIKGAKLSSDQEKMLHVAIQGYFREWFVSSSHYKPITELVRMIDQEF